MFPETLDTLDTMVIGLPLWRSCFAPVGDILYITNLDSIANVVIVSYFECVCA